MLLAPLFGKLQENEMELDRLEIYELDHDKLENTLCDPFLLPWETNTYL